MTKKQSLLSLLLAMCLCMALAMPALAAEDSVDTTSNQARLVDIENDLRQYLEVYHPDMVFGSMEFIEYASDVLLFGSDQDLATLENYSNIRFYLGEYFYQLEENQTANASNDYVFIMPEDYNQRTIADIQAEVAIKEQKAAELNKATEGITPYYNYSGSAAAAYAIKYAISYNPGCNAYPSDCTNFVSQAIHAGGIPITEPASLPEGVMDTTQYWYNRKASVPVVVPRSSTSWIRVTDLYTYLTNNKIATGTECTLNEVQQNAVIGDVVQLHQRGGNWHHSIIITAGQKGNYKYCGHTSNVQNGNISSMNVEKDDSFRIIHFN